MDIRRWMQPKNKKVAEPKKRRIDDDDDDDVIPESPDVQIISKRKKINHDSSKDKNKPFKDKLKEVKTANLFDSGPIKRTEPIVKKDRKKTEIGIHSDEEFEKSLLELDDRDNLEPNDKNNHVDKQKDHKEDNDFKLEKNRHKNHDENYIKSTKSENSVKPKTSGEHRSEKASFKHHNESTPSTSKDNTKTGKEIKKEVKDTNKRKFSEIIEDKTNDSNKKKINDQSEKYKNNDVTITETHGEDEDSANKKRKKNTTLNESVLTDEERYERKIQSARLYQSYLNRSGPKHLGAKEMPEGAADCLKEFAFLLTGVLDSFERDEIVETINKYGGCIKNSISKKVTHVLAGEDAGPAKMAKAQELGIKIISEDEFLQMIKDSNKQTKSDHKESIKDKNHSRKSSKNKDDKRKSSKDRNHVSASNSNDVEKIDVKKERSDHKDRNHDSERKKDKSDHKDKNNTEKSEHKSKRKTEDAEIKKEKSEHKHKSGASENKRGKSEHKDKNKTGDSENKREKSDHHKEKNKSQDINHDKPSNSANVDVVKLEKDLKSESESKSSMDVDKDESKSATDVKVNDNNSIMWVDKHKPQNVKQIIGQLGENSNVNKLINWLTKWYVNRKAKLPKPSPWAKNDDGGYFKAALLSGPPGVGKTTTVALVCKQLGFDTVEFNASDTRNKTLIKGQIGELLTTNSLSAYAKGDSGKQAVTKKHVLVMDEVDGMAGNEDRGGLQELIGLIKSSSVPIICMCNDRNSQKMRSLVNYCYDLRFGRPRVEQIKAAMRSICCRENIKIPPDVLGQLIIAANQDVRQTLNLLSMWAIDPSRMDADRLSKDAAVTKKDIKLGPWEAIRKVFSAEDHKTMSINDKSDLFFYDYSLAPLFVQENYLQVQPHCPKHEVLQRVSAAADSISFGDLIDKRIRSSQAWSLLPMQAMYSSVLPGHHLSGHVGGQIQFPGWLGKNSRASKMHRLCQEIHAHARLSTTGSKSSIFLDYASHLRDAIITPLVKERTEGIEQSIQVLESYNLLREDLDSLVELSVWPGQRNPTVLIDSKVKAAMTRAYNKKATPLPYAPGAVKRARARDLEPDGEEDPESADEDAPDSDPEHDGLIKVQKKNSQRSESSSTSSDKPSTSKGKGKGTGKGKKK